MSLRDVVTDKRCEQQWKNWYNNGLYQSGLVLGLPATSTGGMDYIVHLAPSASDIGGNSSTSDAQLSDQLVLPNFTDLFLHAQNVLRMLPANCQVLGLYTVEPELSDIRGRLFLEQAKLVRQLEAEFQKSRPGTSMRHLNVGEMFILNIGGINTVRCMSIPILSQTSPFSVLKLLVEAKPIKWVCFYAQLDEPFDFFLERDDADKTSSLDRTILPCVRVLIERLSQCRVFVDENPLCGDDMTVAQFMKLQKTDSTHVRTRLYFEVTEPEFCESGKKEDVIQDNGFIKFIGEVSTIVFAHPQQPIRMVDEYLKADLLHSVDCRLRMFLDACPVGINNRSLETVLLPRRVLFWPFPGTSIAFSDYIFAEESTHVVAENAASVLGLTVNDCTVNATREYARCTTKHAAPVKSEVAAKRQSQSSMIVIALWSLSILILGMGLRMYFTISAEEKPVIRHRM